MPYSILKKFTIEYLKQSLERKKQSIDLNTTQQQWAFARVNSFVTKSLVLGVVQIKI